MRMTLTTQGGEVIYLPEEIALDDSALNVDIPGLVIPERHGRRSIPHLKRLEPRTLRASGTIKECTPEEADKLASHLRGQLVGRGKLKLRRNATDDRYIEVECTNITHNYHRGHFGGSLFTLTMTFQADDPFWYQSELSEIHDTIELTPPITLRTITNNGNAPVYPIIWIPGPFTNPKLTNYTTGQTLQFTGTIPEEGYLILDGHGRTAIVIGGNVDHSGVARSGAETSIELADTASDVSNAYVGQLIKIVEGTGTGQTRRILGYNGSTKVAIVKTPWDIIPDVTSSYVIYKAAFLEGYFLSDAMTGKVSGGSSVIAKMNTEFVANGFRLNPGHNLIEYEGEGETLHISIIFRERWL